jgi:hypothetical protein
MPYVNLQRLVCVGAAGGAGISGDNTSNDDKGGDDNRKEKQQHQGGGGGASGGKASQVVGVQGAAEGGKQLGHAWGCDGQRAGCDDEGLMEAARDNANAQAMMAVLRMPEVYEALGLDGPPSSYTPPTLGQLWGAYRLLPHPS